MKQCVQYILKNFILQNFSDYKANEYASEINLNAWHCVQPKWLNVLNPLWLCSHFPMTNDVSFLMLVLRIFAPFSHSLNFCLFRLIRSTNPWIEFASKVFRFCWSFVLLIFSIISCLSKARKKTCGQYKCCYWIMYHSLFFHINHWSINLWWRCYDDERSCFRPNLLIAFDKIRRRNKKSRERNRSVDCHSPFKVSCNAKRDEDTHTLLLVMVRKFNQIPSIDTNQGLCTESIYLMFVGLSVLEQFFFLLQ